MSNVPYTKLILAGEKIICPSCFTLQAIVDVDLYSGSKLNANIFKPAEGNTKIVPGATMTCFKCNAIWGFNGALFTNSKGWVPHNPFGSNPLPEII